MSQGSKITTIEGLGTPDKLSPVQAAFVHNDAQQCGFCTPGFVVACTAMLKAHPNPTPEQVRLGLGRQPVPLRHVHGNKEGGGRFAGRQTQWRCGMTSINWPPQEKRKLIGTRIDRLDGPAKSSGAAKYSLDIQRPDMLYGKIFGAPIAAGTLKSLDTKAAEALHGRRSRACDDRARQADQLGRSGDCRAGGNFGRNRHRSAAADQGRVRTR